MEENYKYLLKLLYIDVSEQLEKRNYYPANNDWEYNEKKFEQAVENICTDIIWEKPDFIWQYIRDYNLD